MLMLLAGLVLYLLVLRTISNYAEDNIRATLDSLLRNAVTIADSEVDRQDRESRIGDSDAALIYQLNARMRFEEFARDQNVRLVVTADEVVDFASGMSPEEAATFLAHLSSSSSGEVYLRDRSSYYFTSTAFTPWGWHIYLIKDAAAFETLIRQVKLIYAGSALALLALTALLVLGLRQLLVRPIYRIAAEFSSGRAPDYKGVKELEALSDSIGETLQSLRAKSLHLETTLQSMSDAITVYDPDMRLVAWNSQYTKLYRFPDTLVRKGASFADIMSYSVDRGDYGPGDPKQQLSEIVERARTLSPARFEVDRIDGTSIEVRRAPMPDGGFVTTATDITDRRQSARFEAANLAKSRFLENMSHDLRKPIAAVIEDCQLITANGRSGFSTADRTIIDNIRGNASHLLGMIDELLDMARIEARQIEVRPRLFNVSSALTQVLRVVEPSASAKGLKIIVNADPEMEVNSDSRLLSRAVMNLLSNAVEYTEVGSINLTCRRLGEHAVVEIADTGIGIADDKLDLIFEKFQRLQPTAGMTRAGMGLGLGLAISREFAHLLGGEIGVASVVGKGSTFTLKIPFADCEGNHERGS
jgi:signal transduction histidine kinase